MGRSLGHSQLGAIWDSNKRIAWRDSGLKTAELADSQGPWNAVELNKNHFCIKYTYMEGPGVMVIDGK